MLEDVRYSFRSPLDLVLGTHDARAAMRELRTVGGMGRSTVWMQLMADVLHCDIVVMDDEHNAGVRGVALLAVAGIGLGWYEGLDHRLLPSDIFPTVERSVVHGGGVCRPRVAVCGLRWHVSPILQVAPLLSRHPCRTCSHHTHHPKQRPKQRRNASLGV